MPHQRPLAAAAWMSGSILAFTAMAISGRAVSGIHDTFEIMAWRSLAGLLLVVATAAALGRLGEVDRDRLDRHALRNVVHFTGQNLWFWALGVIPMAQVFALEFTSPIWVILLSPLLLAERLTSARLLSAALGFVGILIVARPDFGHPNAGVLAAAGSAVCFALTAILTKALTRGESIVKILFWMTLMQLILGGVAAGLDGQVTLPTARTLPWLALIGLSGIVAQLCLTKALSLASASFIMPIDFARLPVIAVVAWALYDEAVGLPVILGGVVIFAANWISIRAETRTRRPQPGSKNL